ncbi:MAG: ATP-binding protein, partial [Ruminococcus sp.]|nr:ATP-binding protein [Ruminococcus sp.]
EEISSGRFNFIKRTKFIVINQGNNSVIVDDDYVYFDTDIIGELARSKLKLHSVNSLTEALKAYECLNINDKNSKCYRFHAQNSDGVPYMLYTYGISKKLINAENRKRIDLADYQKYLLEYSELEQNELLPLGIAADGRYVCKDISFGNKSNDHILITGQSGKGKSFCATNLLPLLAMLGSKMLVCDVSDSFTRDEVLRALPEEVVNSLFEFIDVADGKRKLPVNLLFVGDCSGLPAKKRRIVGFIKAIAGKLDKEEARLLTSIISDMLKRQSNVTSVTTEMLRSTLKRGGKTGHHVFSLISSTLDDIDTIGFEECGWAEFFEKSKEIPVISFGNESGDKVHSLLDAMISSAFEWQRDHDTAPLSIVIDEIKDQNFAEGSPLHTILTQGRKFHTKFIGMTTQYISTSSHAIDVVKEAGIKIFFKPSKSIDRIAAELGYKNPVDAGFGSMGIGDFILSCDCYNKLDGVNEPAVIHCKTIKFVDTPLYGRFKAEYHIS